MRLPIFLNEKWSATASTEKNKALDKKRVTDWEKIHKRKKNGRYIASLEIFSHEPKANNIWTWYNSTVLLLKIVEKKA